MLRNVYALLVFFVLASLSAFAYGQDAQIQGQVLDAAGAAIPKALVRVVDQQTSTERKVETDGTGQYTVPGLAPGLYKIIVEATGFSPAGSDQVTLNPGQHAVFDFTLKVGSASADVVVTAEKREENLQDVPVPMSVLNADQLAENGQARLREYFDQVPGINVTPSYVNEQTITIRGITTGGLTTPTVGITIDDVPIDASSGSHGGLVPDIDPGDLARIEVLRGPQGTLYGADSMGGLLKFVTVDPATDRFCGQLEAGTSGVYNGAQTGFGLRGSANLPLNKTLAMRISGFDRQDPGYIDNPVYHLKGLNNKLSYGGRWSGLWKPSDGLSLKLSALYQNDKAFGLDEVDILPGLTGLQQNYLPGSGGNKITLEAYSAIFKASRRDYDLTSLTGFNINRGTQLLDWTFAFGSTVQSVFGVTGAPYKGADNVGKFVQELRLSIPIRRQLEWLIGGFYTHESDRSSFDVNAENTATGQIVGNYWHFQQASQPDKFDEYAIFTNLTYHLTERFDIQLGGRGSHLKVALGETLQTGPFIGAEPVLGPKESTAASPFTYLVTPRFKIAANLMAYARFASGYRPGTPNLPVPTQPRQSQPDQTKTYEVGTKGDFHNHKLAVDASLYYIDWNNIQIQLTDPVTHLIYNTNGSGAKSEGTEISITTRPATRTTIAAWFDYDNAVLTKAFPANSPTYGVPSDRLPLSSRFSANLSPEKDVVLRNRVLGFVAGQLSYVGDRIGVFGTTTVPQRQFFPSYTKTDLRAGAKYETWTVSVYANNALDKRALVNGGIGYLYPPARIYITPRTIGLSLVKTF
jgi:outer membrane receptor protein involved in Fe transport